MLEAWWITAILDVVAIKHQKQNILTRKFRRRIFSFLLRCLFWRTIQKNFPHCICIFWSISLIGKWTYLVGKSLCSFFIIINSYWQYTVKNSIGKQAYSKWYYYLNSYNYFFRYSLHTLLICILSTYHLCTFAARSCSRPFFVSFASSYRIAD